MKQLKAGNVIDTINKCKIPETDPFTSNYSKVHNAAIESVINKVKELPSSIGPKQGDTVWCRGSKKHTWSKSIFVVEFNSGYHCINYDDGDRAINTRGIEILTPWRYMTTTDPYALKYTLSAQEALVAIGQGSTVSDQAGAKYKLDENDRVVSVPDRVNVDLTLNRNFLYAIVEEYK